MVSAAVVLACAFNLLARGPESFPPIRVLDERPRAVSVSAQAFVSRDDGTIYLIASASVFAEARASVTDQSGCGNRMAMALLASILIHEEWHLRRGPDERAAYQAQLTTLHSLGYGPHTGVYNRVRQAMVVTTARPRTEIVADGRMP